MCWELISISQNTPLNITPDIASVTNVRDRTQEDTWGYLIVIVKDKNVTHCRVLDDAQNFVEQVNLKIKRLPKVVLVVM